MSSGTQDIDALIDMPFAADAVSGIALTTVFAATAG